MDQVSHAIRPISAEGGDPGTGDPPSGRSWWSQLAWLVVLVASILAWLLQPYLVEEADVNAPAIAIRPPGIQIEFTGRILMAMETMFSGDNQLLVSQASPLLDGSLTDQLAYPVLVGLVLGDFETALDSIDECMEHIDDSHLGPEDKNQLESVAADIRTILQKRQDDAKAVVDLDSVQQSRAERLLGWFGEIMVAEASSDQVLLDRYRSASGRLFLTLIGAGAWFLSCLFIGFSGGIIFFVLALSNVVRSRMGDSRLDHVVYLETFCIWMFLVLLLRLPMGYLPEQMHILGSGFVMLMSLVVIAWPVLRRRGSFKQVCMDVGLSRSGSPGSGSGNVFYESICGFFGYCMGIPLIIVGSVISLVLAWLYRLFFGEEPGMASHPIQDVIAGGGIPVIVQVYFVACVVAPLVEEILFRGVLYRYFRSTGRSLPNWLMIPIWIILSSFIFAVIHPQGVIFAPTLMGIGAALAILREWRGSLVAPMVAHCVTNSVTITLNLLLFS